MTVKHGRDLCLDQLPFTLHGYTFTKEIGSGGTARVFLVNSEKFQQVFVAKLITLSHAFNDVNWRSVTAEMTALGRLNCPNVIRLYDHFRYGRYCALILEYCPGGSLSDLIPNGGMKKQDFCRIAREIASALAFCHQKSVAHRDLKPSNILIDEYGRVKLADFGLSIHVSSRMMQHSCCGTLIYTAPEVLEKKVSSPFAADIWSLGILFLVMAQGASPWRSRDPKEVEALVKSGKFWINPNVDPEIRDLILFMLVVDPAKRPTIQSVLRHDLFNDTEMIRSDSARVISPARLAETARTTPQTSRAGDGFIKRRAKDVVWKRVGAIQSSIRHSSLRTPQVKLRPKMDVASFLSITDPGDLSNLCL